jgi:hypothetical protein
MEKLILLAIVLLGSAISSYFQNKKKREEEELERREPGPRTTSGEPPVPHWPKTGRDWQEELRRVLQGQPQPPPSTHRQSVPPKVPPPARPPTAPPAIVRTKVILRASSTTAEPSEGAVTFPSPLKQSVTAYARASELAGRVESRLQAVDAQTQGHKSVVPARRERPSGARIIRRWSRSRESLREAFIASLIFAPPVGLRD